MPTIKYPARMEEDKYSWLWKPIYKRILTKNQQFSSVIAGRTGSGKSYLALGVGETFNPDFKVEESVFFTARDFAKKVAQPLKKAEVLILDDSGLSIHSSEAMKLEIRNISKTLQSIRHRGLVVILTMPSLNLIAKSTRVLSDYYFEPLRIDYRTNETITKFQRLTFNPISGDMYRANAERVSYEKNPNTGLTECKRRKYLQIKVPKASDKICKAYDKYKKERMKEFDEQNYLEIENQHSKKIKKSLTNKQLAGQIKRWPDKFMLNNRLSIEKIMYELDVGRDKAKSLRKMVETS